MRDGRLEPGTVVPSSRALAADLQLSRGTVVEAYAQLVAEGYFVARMGSVTAVADAIASDRGNTSAQPKTPRPTAARVDLRPGLLDLGATFPRAEWQQAERAALRTAPDAAFDYGDPRGSVELRTALASYLSRARGVLTSPERLVICTGFAHGLDILTTALRALGVEAVAMEDPCLPAHRAIVARRQVRICSLPVDDDGADIEAVHDPDVRSAIVTPAHQYPTGATLSPRRRAQLVAWAQRVDGFIVEDDYDGEFRYDRQPVGALQGLDPNRVVYAGTASKTLAPGIRIGWLALPPALVPPVLDLIEHGGALPAALHQLAFAQMLETGQLDRHLRRLRIGYRARRDKIVAAIATAIPELEPTGIAAGLHVLVYLGTNTPESNVRAVADKHGIALAYLGSHWHDPVGQRQGVIIGYSKPSAPAFDEVVEDLVAVLRHAVNGAECPRES